MNLKEIQKALEDEKEEICVSIRIKTKLCPLDHEEEEDSEFDEIKNLLGNFNLKETKVKL